VLVEGGGQSALESAALLHEKGADVEVVVRAGRVNWLHGGKYHRRLGRAAPLVYAPTDVGPNPMGLSRLVAVPNLFRRLPRAAQEPLAYQAIRPAGAAWLVPRLREVPVHLATECARPPSGRGPSRWSGRTIYIGFSLPRSRRTILELCAGRAVVANWCGHGSREEIIGKAALLDLIGA
jgi:hypothetical protein